MRGDALTMRLVGTLLVEACQTLRQRARELAAELLGAPVDAVRLGEGIAASYHAAAPGAS